MTVSRVRIPLSPFALLAQLDRVFGYGPKGRGFESLTARKTVTDCHGLFFIVILIIKIIDFLRKCCFFLVNYSYFRS